MSRRASFQPQHERAELQLRQLTEQEIRRWREGRSACANSFLREHPEIARQKSLVVDLAYAEYLSRHSAGESLELKAYCRRFPGVEKSLLRCLAMHYVLNDSSVFDEGSGTEPEIDWPVEGELFHGLRIDSELGRGGFARVYLARETQVADRHVALKVCHQGGDEAFTLGRLDHPHIMPVYSVDEDDRGVTRICMPYFGRATLADVIAHTRGGEVRESATTILSAVANVNRRRPPRSPDDQELIGFGRFNYVEGVLEIATGLADALAYLHQLGLRHQDLKPSNVLVTAEGSPILLDFNLAVEGADSARVGGTLPYMSPEQLRLVADPGSEVRLDERSDIYSLGLVLYELLTGALPWAAETVAWGESRTETARQLLAQRRSPDRLNWPEDSLVGYGLRAIIADCLQPQPEDRPQTMREVQRAIASERRWPTRLVRLFQSHPLVTGVAALLIVACLLGGMIFAWTRPPFQARQWKLARQAYQANDVATARGHLDTLLARHPDDHQGLDLRIRINGELGQHDFVLRDIGRRYKGSDPVKYHALRGYVLQRMFSWGDARHEYEQALQLGEVPAWVHNNLGVLMYPRDRAGSLNILDRGHRLHPGVDVLNRNRARVQLVSMNHVAADGLPRLEEIDRLLGTTVEPNRGNDFMRFYVAARLAQHKVEASAVVLSRFQALEEHLPENGANIRVGNPPRSTRRRRSQSNVSYSNLAGLVVMHPREVRISNDRE